MVPPTPIAALRYPVAASPPANTSVAMTTMRIPTPPNTNQLTDETSVTPPTAPSLMPAARSSSKRPGLTFVASASSSGFGAAPGRGFNAGSVHRITAISRNETAFRAKARPMSPVTSSRPAIPGPTIQAKLSSVAYALFAGPNSRSSRTRLGSSAPITR